MSYITILYYKSSCRANFLWWWLLILLTYIEYLSQISDKISSLTKPYYELNMCYIVLCTSRVIDVHNHSKKKRNLFFMCIPFHLNNNKLNVIKRSFQYNRQKSYMCTRSLYTSYIHCFTREYMPIIHSYTIYL